MINKKYNLLLLIIFFPPKKLRVQIRINYKINAKTFGRLYSVRPDSNKLILSSRDHRPVLPWNKRRYFRDEIRSNLNY